jgi:hypothetical protein
MTDSASSETLCLKRKKASEWNVTYLLFSAISITINALCEKINILLIYMATILSAFEHLLVSETYSKDQVVKLYYVSENYTFWTQTNYPKVVSLVNLSRYGAVHYSIIIRTFIIQPPHTQNTWISGIQITDKTYKDTCL